jgi:hypothetical protein
MVGQFHDLDTLSRLLTLEQGATGAAKETLPAFGHGDRSRETMDRTGTGFAETRFASGEVLQRSESNSAEKQNRAGEPDHLSATHHACSWQTL